VNYGEYTIYVIQGATSGGASNTCWAKVVVKRSTNVIDTKIINCGSHADFTSLFFRVDVIDVKKTGENIVGVDLAIGLIGIECVAHQITTTTNTNTSITSTIPINQSTTNTTSTTIIPGSVTGEIHFDKKEYNFSEPTTVSWSWSNAGTEEFIEVIRGTIFQPPKSTRYGVWVITSPHGNRTTGNLNQDSGSDKTTIKMGDSGEWKAELYVCDKTNCNTDERKNAVIFEDSATVKGTELTGNCVSIHSSGDPSKKLDIIFLAHNYKDFSIFASDVSLHTNTLFSIEPFKSNSNRINIWRVDKNFDLGCYGDWAIFCDATKVAEAAYNCPADQVVILTEFAGGGCGGYSTVNARLEGANRTTVHEFGHCFGDLLDEYLYGDKSTESGVIPHGPNCDDSSCDAWGGMLGTSCIKDCSFTNWYRPTNQSVMNNHWDIKNFYFNSPSVRQLQNLLNAYSDQTPAPLPEPAKIYFLKFNYNKGVVTLKNISIDDGFVPDRNIQPAVGYEMGLLSKSGEALQSFVFDPPKQMFYDYVDNGEVKGGVIERDNFDFVEIAPYSTDTSSINVLSQNKEVLSADFSTLAKQNKLYMVTSEGDKQITLTTDDASKAAGITAVKQVDIKEENAMPIYSVNGTQEAKLLFIIPVSMDIQAKVNAQNGQVISSVKPWWSAFTS